MKIKVTDLEEFALVHIFRPYQNMILDDERLERLPMPLSFIPEFAEENPEWWSHVCDRIRRIGFVFPDYIRHELVDLITQKEITST